MGRKNVGAIAGGIVGGAFAIVAIGASLLYLRHSKQLQAEIKVYLTISQ
jgi:hypothetical protein